MAAAAAAAAATLERLEALACPAVALLVPLEPAEALRLLCTPSARRLALLEWVCSRVHPPLAARLEALQDGPKDARLRELAKLGAELMLCRADDVALVEGTAPPEQQLEFIRDLLDAAPPPGEEDGGSPKSRRSALHRTTRFLHEVLETPEGVAALSPPSPPPLPAFDDYGSPPPRAPSWGGRRARPPPSCPPWGWRGATWPPWLRLLGRRSCRTPGVPWARGSPPSSPPAAPWPPPSGGACGNSCRAWRLWTSWVARRQR
ncbi:HAUS augmin-like complex subunit 7 isoform X3 [Mycteria americana]|uniref:HAUS augmin-like complex subunit 7 isoform X3 n=1 Tax=Mycteria americana TaxID=33587 RepID=UPI003F58173E